MRSMTYTRQWFDYSEQRMIAALRKIPAGALSGYSTHDPVPGTPPDGIRIKVDVAVEKRRGYRRGGPARQS